MIVQPAKKSDRTNHQNRDGSSLVRILDAPGTAPAPPTRNRRFRNEVEKRGEQQGLAA